MMPSLLVRRNIRPDSRICSNGLYHCSFAALSFSLVQIKFKTENMCAVWFIIIFKYRYVTRDVIYPASYSSTTTV